jgi:predicted O-methyltransferase YrrM
MRPVRACRRMIDRLLNRTIDQLNVEFVKKEGWLAANLASVGDPPRLPVHDQIEERAAMTNSAGERPLWAGYKGLGHYTKTTEGGRTSDQVRTAEATGRLYTWLASTRKSGSVVEFGSAFGVSGMYWLAGLSTGHLYTFEPNADWAGFARENLGSVGRNFTLTADTFENAGPSLLSLGSVDIAFIDAIHTSEFVFQQYAVLRPLMRSAGLILFDDIDFSADMRSCWKQIARDPGLVASATIGRRVGIIELPA